MSDVIVQTQVGFASAEPLSQAEPRHGLSVRLVALIVALVAISPLLVGVWLEPLSGGVGTHSELGLPACAFLQSTRMPCATCGMTTSFALAAHGRVVQAVLNQPAGGVLAILAAAASVGGFFTVLTGISLWPLIEGFVRPKFFLGAGMFFILAWIYKIIVMS